MRFVEQINDWGYGWGMAVQHGQWRHGVHANLRNRERVPFKLRVKARRALKQWATTYPRSNAGRRRTMRLRRGADR